MNPFSQQTLADDTTLYRSQFEADVVNRYFIPCDINFEYEKYYENSRKKCDFYLSDFDIYIECVYHDVEIYYKYQTLPIGEKIYVDIGYTEKEAFKNKYRTKWDGEQWYIANDGKAKNYLHDRIKDKSLLKALLKSDGKAITDSYDDNLRKKLVNNKGNIVFLTKKNLEKYESLGDFLSSKNNPDINSRVFKSVFCEAYKPKTVSVISGKKMSMVEDLNMQIKSAKRDGERVAQKLKDKIEHLERQLSNNKKEIQSLSDRLRNAKGFTKKKKPNKRHYKKRLTREEISSGSLQGALGREN